MTLINGDCIEYMKDLIEDGRKVDLVVTDPPYLGDSSLRHSIVKNHRFKKPIKNERNRGMIKQMIKQVYRLLKDGSAFYCFCDANHLCFFKKEIAKYFKVKNILIWLKNNQTGGDLQGDYGRKNEFIIYAVKGRHFLNGRRDNTILEYKMVAGSRKVHQNQKPVDLMEFLIEKSSQPKDLVLDPFMGSGTTGVACRNTGRDFIGVELDEDYYDIAVERIKGEG